MALLTNLEQGAGLTRISTAVVSACLTQLPMLAQVTQQFEVEHTDDEIKVPTYAGITGDSDVRTREADGEDANDVDYDSFVGDDQDISFVSVKPDQPCKIEMTLRERDLVAASRSNYIPEMARIKGHALAKKLADKFFTAVDPATDGPDYLGTAATPGTPSNYPTSTMDGDMLNDIQAALEASEDCFFPQLLLQSQYKHALRKDKGLVPAENVANVERDGVILQNLFQFNELGLSFSKYVPDPRSQNLVGMAFDRMAIAAAFMPGPAATTSGTNYLDAGVITDPATGFSLSYKTWHDPNSGTYRTTWEVYAGFKVLDANRIKLLRSATPS